MLKILKRISTEIKYINPWWEYRFDKYINPIGTESEYHYVHTPGSVFIIPQLSEDKFIMTRQFRYLNQKTSIEFPGGGVKPHKSFFENAVSELEEETGYFSEDLKQIGIFNPFNGVTDEICNVFLAKSLKKTEIKPEPSEEFEILELNKFEIINKIIKGEIWDGMTLAAWSVFFFAEK